MLVQNFAKTDYTKCDVQPVNDKFNKILFVWYNDVEIAANEISPLAF